MQRCVFIMQRAMAIAKAAGYPPTEDFGLAMYYDLIALHCNGCPLNLTAMCYAPPELLMGDLATIKSNIVRATATLPDFAKRQLHYAKDSGIIVY